MTLPIHNDLILTFKYTKYLLSKEVKQVTIVSSFYLFLFPTTVTILYLELLVVWHITCLISSNCTFNISAFTVYVILNKISQLKILLTHIEWLHDRDFFNRVLLLGPFLRVCIFFFLFYSIFLHSSIKENNGRSLHSDKTVTKKKVVYKITVF